MKDASRVFSGQSVRKEAMRDMFTVSNYVTHIVCLGCYMIQSFGTFREYKVLLGYPIIEGM